jgi:ABC transport system ATP-binding/permease protein
MTTLLSLKSIQKDFGIKQILKDASFSLETGDKVGLIGTNGSGKSTLLKMIAGIEPIDGGEVWRHSGSHMVYLPQQPELEDESTVLDQVFAQAGEQMALVREYERLSDQLAHFHVQGNPQKLELLMSQLSQISDRIEAAGAWDLETQAKVILSKLGIEDFEARVGDLSGGYRKRIALAAALLSDPDALLMDEPTNHLDADSVEWLQDYLKRFRGAVLLITHDRYFLDQVTTRILEIDQGELYAYSGNYGYYLEKKAEVEDSIASSQRKHAGVLRRELEWLKRGPKARSTKQKARIDRIMEMQNKTFKESQGKVDISTVGRRIGKKVIEVEAISKRWDDRVIIEEFTYIFNPDDRIGIIGPNGVGKSTLVNLITGRLEPDQGHIERGSTIHIGYFDQHSDDLSLKGEQRVIEYLKDVAELVKTKDGSVITASQMLERFLFSPNQQYAPIHKLSGGEKRRLFLLRVLMEAPNVLILDEPTNDLDVQTLGILEEYLEEFNGCVIIVSHDRYFLDRTINTLFIFEPSGKIRHYTGNYSLYVEQRKAEEPVVTIAPRSTPGNSELSPPSTPPKTRTTQTKRLSYKEQKEYEHLAIAIPQWEAEKEQLERQLYQTPPSDFTVLQRMTEQLSTLNTEIDRGTERWLELAERCS